MSKQTTAQEKENALQKKRKKETSQRSKRPLPVPDQLQADNQLLQQTMGNQALGQALGGGVQRQPEAVPDVNEILKRPITSVSSGGGEMAVQRIPNKKRRKNAREQEAAKIEAEKQAEYNKKHGWFGSETWSGKAASMFGYGESKRKDDGDMSQHEKEGTVGAWDEVAEEKAEKEDKADEAAIFDVKKITITLKEVEKEKEGDYGSAKAKGGLQANIEGVEGEAELEAQLGGGGKFVDKDFGWKVANGKLGVQAEAEGFLGAKAEAKGKAGVKYDKEKGYSAAAKGKASAFAGGELTGSTQVSIKAGDDTLISSTGKLGVTWGVGGEFQFNISWEGGKFSAGGKAKAAAGWGFSAGYNIEINTQTIAGKLWGWMKDFWSTLDDEEWEQMWV